MKSLNIRVEALGEISKDLGQIFFASVFLAGIMGSDINNFITVSGFILSLIFWSIYVLLAKK